MDEDTVVDIEYCEWLCSFWWAEVPGRLLRSSTELGGDDPQGVMATGSVGQILEHGTAGLRNV